jgi:hypothetical protein
MKKEAKFHLAAGIAGLCLSIAVLVACPLSPILLCQGALGCILFCSQIILNAAKLAKS